MRKLHQLTFDDFVVSGGTVYTKTDLNDILGQVDQLAIQAIVDQVNANGSTTIQIQHSADQINWTNKNATAEINAGTLSTNTTCKLFGSDAGSTPSLGYVRLAISLTTTNQAHIKIWVTGRNQG